MECINLTPHSIRLVTRSGESFTLSRSAKNNPIRIQADCIDIDDINGVPIKEVRPILQAERELPPLEDNKIYIVSRMVADVYRDIRRDFYYPYDLRRNDNGVVVGCYSIARFGSSS